MPRLVCPVLALLLVVAACSSDDETTLAPLQSTNPPTTTEQRPAEAPTTTTEASTTAPTSGPSAAEKSAAEGCAAQETGTSTFTLETDTVTHSVRVFVPPSFDGSPVPLVMNFHGLGSDGPQQAIFTDYETLARTEGFIVVHPTGLPAEGDNRNAWELEQFDAPDRDDIAMTELLIDRMVADWCVDPRRVYATGMSNGGFFTSRLVCELPNRIAAAVSVAGLTHPDSCQPDRAVPFMAFHGTADEVVPFAGGTSSLADDAAERGVTDFFDQVMPEEFAQFAASAGCNTEPTSTPVSEEVIRYDYAGCDDGAELIFFEVIDGGHTWPGSPLGPFLGNTLGYTTDDRRATQDGWAFMQRFALPA